MDLMKGVVVNQSGVVLVWGGPKGPGMSSCASPHLEGESQGFFRVARALLQDIHPPQLLCDLRGGLGGVSGDWNAP